MSAIEGGREGIWVWAVGEGLFSPFEDGLHYLFWRVGGWKEVLRMVVVRL